MAGEQPPRTPPNSDPFLINYQPSELRIASEFLGTWLPFLTRDLCRRCSQSLTDRIRSIDPESQSPNNIPVENSDDPSHEVSDECHDNCDANSIGSWKEAEVTPALVEAPSPRKSWADMAQEDDEFGEDDSFNSNSNSNSHSHSHSNSNVVVFGSIPCKTTTKVAVPEKPTLSREQRELIRFMKVERKKEFRCYEKINGKYVNILEGLELHTGIFSNAEQIRIVELVTSLQEMGRKGELKDRTFSAPQKWMRGKGRQTLQFGCCYNYALDRDGNPPGILKASTVDPIPDLFKVIIRRLVRWHVLPPTCVPDSCIVNIYEEGDCIPPHIDNHDFVRPFCTVSFLSKCNILFGSHLKTLGPGEFDGDWAIPLPVGSVLVINGNAADVAKHCVPAVPTKRISITFRRMDESKRPVGFVPEPDLQGIQPLPYEIEQEHKSPLPYEIEQEQKSPLPYEIEQEQKSSGPKPNRHMKRHKDRRGGRNDAAGSATRSDRFSEPLDSTPSQSATRSDRFSEPRGDRFSEPRGDRFSEPRGGRFSEPRGDRFSEPRDSTQSRSAARSDRFSEPRGSIQSRSAARSDRFSEPRGDRFSEYRDSTYGPQSHANRWSRVRPSS